MGLTVHDLKHKKRDLTDVLSTIIQNEPTFIHNFGTVNPATQQKHEWLEDQITARAFVATAAADGVLTVAKEESAKLLVDTLVVLKDNAALFRVTAKTDTSVTLALVAANGSSLTAATLPAAGGQFNIVTTPMKEGTSNDDGEESYRFLGTEHNATQIFRKEIILTGTALAVNTYGDIEGNLNRQTEFALRILTRDLNRVALFGVRVLATPLVKGSIGGLYFFATQDGGMSVDASGNTLDSFIVNDAAQAILGEGGNPVQILCGVGQARVLSNEYRDRLHVIREDSKRGAYVAQIVNEINGRVMTIVSDPDMPDTDVWLLDPAGFGLSNLQGRAIYDEDATPKGYDGQRRMALGELTLEFKNARQRCCLVKNLKTSPAALAAIRNKLQN